MSVMMCKIRCLTKDFKITSSTQRLLSNYFQNLQINIRSVICLMIKTCPIYLFLLYTHSYNICTLIIFLETFLNRQLQIYIHKAYMKLVLKFNYQRNKNLKLNESV